MDAVFDILNAAAAAFGEQATLKKKTGETITVNITPHEADAENFNGRYPGAFSTCVFSVDCEELKIDGTETRPEEGDVVEIARGERTDRYKVVKDADSARTWTWIWNRNVKRIKFYTMKVN